MKGAIVMLMLLGCDCDGVACEYVRTVSTEWSSIQSCEAAAGIQAAAAQTESYPLIIAQCVVDGGSAAPAEEAAEDLSGLAANGQVLAHDGSTRLGEAGPGWSSGRMLNLASFGAAYSIRAVGSRLRTYAGQPVRAISDRVVYGIRR